MATSLYQFTQYNDDDEQEDIKHFITGKDITLFVIDVGKSMFKEIIENETPFDVCLTVLEKLFLAKIRHNSNDQIAVIFYNTQHSPEPKSDVQIACPDQCAILFTLQSIESDIIRFIKNMKASGDYHDFATKYGHSKDTQLSEVLWLCNALVSNSGIFVRNCTIVWFTDNDQPHQLNTPEYTSVMQKTADLHNLHPDFQLVPLKETFKKDLFYNEFLQNIMKDRDEIEFPTPTIDTDELARRLLTRSYRNRALSYLTVEILDRPQFSVGIYTFTSKKSGPRSETISRVTKEVVKSKRSYKYGHFKEDNEDDLNVSFNEKLTAEKTIKYLEVGGEKVKFTPLETYEMKQFMQPAIKILGFKPLETFNPLNHKRSPYFVYPSENQIKHSTKTFRALWETCLNKSKYILCIVCLRLKSNPRFVALIPQRENANQTQFDGFRMEFLPFAGEIRDLSQKMPVRKEVSDKALTEMAKAISKLTINYDVTMFKNPAISKLYNKIERIEFSEDVEDPPEDVTLPKVEEQDRRIDAYASVLKEMYSDLTDKSSKRKATCTQGGSSAKKPALDINEDMLVELCKKDDVKNINVPVLREYLKSKNVSGLSKMNKEQLVRKIVEIS
ncbi:hypothetical protein PVAND_011204 [Polypedilum vanderplanki]|uniref:Ku domain-containing protein n=1 Tax=Polypedilum vanderplanki TaxID=319348 RepID=A0A9J6CIE3_POLVA|nr:hypothetical protein PVAND_011204 [Polypedilum vanderplanki]